MRTASKEEEKAQARERLLGVVRDSDNPKNFGPCIASIGSSNDKEQNLQALAIVVNRFGK